jgi:hypothetical protein
VLDSIPRPAIAIFGIVGTESFFNSVKNKIIIIKENKIKFIFS